jgi:Na+/H+ antiporter NhaD/arsenite permease-like protein
MFDFLTVKNLVVFIFFLVYALIVMKYDRKTYFVWGGIIAVLLLGALSPFEAFAAINWNVIGIYIGMLFIAESLLYSKLPDALAAKIVGASKKTWIAMLGVCFLSGLLSAVVENVAVVLITAPIALAVSKKLKTNPAPLVIGIALMSNLQGVATMIGDPPSLLVAYYAKLNFNDFFFFQGKPSLFFAVQIGAIAALGVLYFFFRKNNQARPKIKAEKVKSVVPGVILALLVVMLAAASLVSLEGSPALSFINSNKLGIISVACGALIAAWQYPQDKKKFVPMVKRLDWGTGLFLIGIFIIVESLIKIGFMQDVAMFIASIVGSDVFIAYIIIVVTSVAFSAFIDNVPFVAAMLPVTGHLAQLMGVSAYPLYFGLVLGASIGGNITPVGASANVVAMGILKKNGHQPTFFEFVKMGLPFTIVSVIASTAFIWLMFG